MASCASPSISLAAAAAAAAPRPLCRNFPSRRAKFPALRAAAGPDLFLLDLAEKLEESVSGDVQSPTLKALHEASAELALNCSWPTSKDEEYRFTDVKFLKGLNVCPVSTPDAAARDTVQLRDRVEDDGTITLVFVDGIYTADLSRTTGIPDGIFTGSILSASDDRLSGYILPRLEQEPSASSADVFASLNGIGALDWGVVVIPKDYKLEPTVHVVYYSSKGGETAAASDNVIAMSNPRLLIVAEEGSQLKLVEEFVGAEDGAYWTNSVCEIVVAAGASISHSVIQIQGRSSVNVKKTHVSQDKNSSYKLVEVELGGKLSRHNLHVEQLGPDTSTEMSTFLLCGHSQLQDLHSKLVLSHPRGFGKQLHKSIVTSPSGHAVFDGNIRVNKYAQQTDAGQLSRCLLLAPRATVNIRPNLQIVADDVKCSHGAAISDLEEEQLFYFLARGINAQAARSALVFSFGAEVVDKLEDASVKRRVEEAVRNALTSEGAVRS